MLFCKGQCNFNACKDSFCLLSNLVGHILIAYRPLGSFFSFVILLYILLSCQLKKIQNKSASIDSGLPGVLVLIFECEPMCHTVEHEVKVRNLG